MVTCADFPNFLMALIKHHDFYKKRLRNVSQNLNYNLLPYNEAAYINANYQDTSVVVTHVENFLVVSKPEKKN